MRALVKTHGTCDEDAAQEELESGSHSCTVSADAGFIITPNCCKESPLNSLSA